ncbi:MAG TPA: glycerol-3-phosphate 1-O-acyltransferase PlsY [Terriglobia bacterium]|nr:glycerol-3-phosphate 1-O-acyltransferase PlsY [Terriglobia bacterium]
MRNLLWAGAAGYLLGSIPFGYLLYRARGGGDIRRTGSGNIGATNVLRAAGWLPAAATLVLDAGKGYAAVWLAACGSANAPDAVAAAILAVMAGHCFPLFLRFRGGKGVATGFGAFLGIAPAAALTASIVFALVAAVTGYVSLASILAAAAFPVLLLGMGSAPPVLLAAFSAAGLIVLRHRENIRRLRQGTELRLFGKKKPPDG